MIVPGSVNPLFMGGMLSGGVSGDPFWDDVVLLMHMEGPNNSTTFIDEKGHSNAAVGNAKISTTSPLMGTSSARFDGTSLTCVTFYEDTDFELPGAFTIEFLIKLDIGPVSETYRPFSVQKNLSTSTTGSVRIDVPATGTDDIDIFFGGAVTGHIDLTAVTHIACVRGSGTDRIYINGSLAASGASNSLFTQTPQRLSIGAFISSISGCCYTQGYMDEVRLTRAERYTGNFIPPTQPHPDY